MPAAPAVAVDVPATCDGRRCRCDALEHDRHHLLVRHAAPEPYNGGRPGESRRYGTAHPVRCPEDGRSSHACGSRVTHADGAQIQGNVFHTTFDNVKNLSAGEIALISCATQDYNGLFDAQSVFRSAYERGNLLGVLLYSTVDDYCSYKAPASQDLFQDFPVLSMTNRSASASLLDAVKALPSDQRYAIKVQGRGEDGNNTGGGMQGGPYTGSQANPLGPSPSTAVAMIILYSITGIITALFLVIIVTGAVRAHRHPERYGPRDVLGRPRQSRARGLGRAILDTIPIVKFGEKEPGKPTDVELASTAEARDANATNDASARTDEAGNETRETSQSKDTANPASDPTAVPTTDESNTEGIAPAQSAAVAGTGADKTSQDDSLVCSICTEDFEKGQDLRVLPCDHKFHPECVDPWLLNVSGTCPLW